MKVEATALRALPLSVRGDDVRHIRAGQTFEINLSRARALRDAGKVKFDEPKDAGAKPARKRKAKAAPEPKAAEPDPAPEPAPTSDD